MDEPSPLAHARAAEHAPHVLPVRVLLGTAASLLALTAVTVAISRMGVGGGVGLALGIATLKATLVALFFMHLRYEGRFTAVVLVAAALFAALFVSFVMFDTLEYQPDLRASETQAQAPRAAPAR